MKSQIIKNTRLTIISFIFGGIIFLSAFTYANTYNSEEISYDTSTSGAVQANVKDALDFLYNKTKSGASSECPENMSCVEKPGVVMSVTGPGTVDKGTVYIGIGETATFIVTPNDGYTLHSISCNNDYTVSGFGSHPSDTTNAPNEQTVTLTNPNTSNGGTCTITFGVKYVDINVSSSSSFASLGGDSCSSWGTGCACACIKWGGSNFTFNGHTGCNFISTSCTLYKYGTSFSCSSLSWTGGNYGWTNGYANTARCSGTIRCAT